MEISVLMTLYIKYIPADHNFPLVQGTKNPPQGRTFDSQFEHLHLVQDCTGSDLDLLAQFSDNAIGDHTGVGSFVQKFNQLRF